MRLRDSYALVEPTRSGHPPSRQTCPASVVEIDTEIDLSIDAAHVALDKAAHLATGSFPKPCLSSSMTAHASEQTVH